MAFNWEKNVGQFFSLEILLYPANDGIPESLNLNGKMNGNVYSKIFILFRIMK